MRISNGVKKAVVLLSGGLDSATTLYIARKRGYDTFCLIFDYGQRHGKEVEIAKKIARISGSEYKVIKIGFPWKGSSLLDRTMRLPKGDKNRKTVPSTYVPARNTVFLSFALSCAEARRAEAIFIGANALDYSGYPDCRPEFYRAFNKLSRMATKCGIEKKAIKVETPLIDMKKSDIIRLGLKLGVPYEHTWSCYKGGGSPCGSCDSCVIRERGFSEAGRVDPARR